MNLWTVRYRIIILGCSTHKLDWRAAVLKLDCYIVVKRLMRMPAVSKDAEACPSRLEGSTGLEWQSEGALLR